MIKTKANEYDFFKLYDQFVKQCHKGQRLQKNGKRLRKTSVDTYLPLRKLLLDFSFAKDFPLRFRQVAKLKKRELVAEKKYWKEFYSEFTDFLYNDLDCFDNYVGTNISRLRAFFNYLNEEKELGIGNFHKKFYCHREQIDIITLSPSQLRFLIHDRSFEASLPDHLQRTKDMFVFGCTVALRVSDIFRLTIGNIEKLEGNWYLRISSQKTNTFTRILLPSYAVDILRKYNGKTKTLFPLLSLDRFNTNIKSLIEKTGWNDTRVKTRQKRGVPVEVFKNAEKKQLYRFCDMVSSHTMRRTAITTMLCLNMPEHIVRQISGHAAGSKEFYKYVKLSQQYMDTEVKLVFDKLNTTDLIATN